MDLINLFFTLSSYLISLLIARFQLFWDIRQYTIFLLLEIIVAELYALLILLDLLGAAEGIGAKLLDVSFLVLS